MRAVDIIERKRNGEELTTAEIDFLIEGYVADAIPDYQMSAWCMAVVWRGMTTTETEALTRAMIASGDTVRLDGIGRPTVDKHSTGGVGDKTTLVVAPLAASMGVAVPKLSGRGLGHTGGTLDKLESIPGLRIDLSLEELVRVCRDTGMAVAGPTADVVPADKRMYALRDASGTVRSLPLIVSSIMSKKLAVETEAIVLDVKVGEGAFFTTLDAAREFARAAIALGHGFGRRVRCVLTAMDRPLGRAVGNLLEVDEAIATLRGEGPADFVEVCIEVAAQMVLAAAPESDPVTVRRRVTEQLRDGAAFTVFDHWVATQGGDLEAVITGRVPHAGRIIPVTATAGGNVARVHALAIGQLAMMLGAGRATKDDVIDHAAGIVFDVSVGDHVEPGQTIANLHTNKADDATAWTEVLRGAVELTDAPVVVGSPVIDVIGAEAGAPA